MKFKIGNRQFKLMRSVCPHCENEHFKYDIAFEPGKEPEEFYNPRLQMFCKVCRNFEIIPLAANTVDDLRKRTLFTESLSYGTVVKLSDKLSLMGVKGVI